MLNTITFTVKGVTFDGRQANLKKVAENPDFRIRFAKDTENKYDKNAIKVFATTLTDEVEVGFIPKEIAEQLKGVSKVKIVRQDILGGTEEKPTYGMLIGLEVELNNVIKTNTWENDPMTENQKKAVNYIAAKHGVDISNIKTKKQASDLISKYPRQ